MKLLRFLLFPFAVVFDLITSIRNFLYDKEILKSTSYDIPVIAVGNLSVGGTGKTPQIEYLVNLFKEKYNIAILSRGYKRKTKGFLLVDKKHNADQVGDEPLQYFKKFSTIKVAVDANRTNGINKLLQLKDKPEVILLDDAYQHRKVKAGFYILLTKFNDLYTDDFLLPTGNLRESKSGAKRATIIVVTKCPKDLSTEKKLEIIKKIAPKNHQQIFFSTISYHNYLKGNSKIALDLLKEYQIVLITGIANPTLMVEFLDSKKIKFQHLQYPDHHYFTAKDIVKINSIFNSLNSDKKLIITTEKDYVRLENKLNNISYIPIKTLFLNGNNNFDKAIKTCFIS